MYGVIDIGANTIRLSIFKYNTNSKKIKLITNKKFIVGLTSYVRKGQLSIIGINKVCRTLLNLKSTLENFELKKYSVFATASLRNISNTEEVLSEIKKVTGMEPEILNGEEEARLDFIGAKDALDLERGILVDIGGGSTEIVLFENGEIQKLTSIPVGALNLQNKVVKHIVPEEKEIKRMKKIIREKLKELKWENEQNYKNLYAIGGSSRACMNVIKESKNLPLEDKTFFVNELYDMISILKNGGTNENTKELYRIIPERIFSFAGGVVILKEVAEMFGSEKVIISKNGVREGYFLDRIVSNMGENENEI